MPIIYAYWIALLGSFLIGAFARADDDKQLESKSDQFLVAGWYSQISTPRENVPHDHAVWAFAQYHLAPTKAVAKSAQLAHKNGDALGTFVLMLCQRTGSGLLRDRAEVARLNFDLRTKLEKLEMPSPLELYMLCQCQPGDEKGRTRNADADKLFAELDRQRKVAGQRLKKSAELGFAQACQDVALAEEDQTEAHKWHLKAAGLGLAEGMRYAGLQLMVGAGVQKDAGKGLEMSLKAAKGGDVYAMINLVVFYDQGRGVKKDADQAQHWLNAAAESGHWYGLVEKGMSLLEGHYGSKVDREKGLQALQKAAKSGHSEALKYVATAYAKGFGLKRDGKRAVQFAEAAYRQGSAEAASVLAFIYTKGLKEIEANEEHSQFWATEAERPGLGLELLTEKSQKDFLLRIDAIDPFILKVE